MYYPCNENKAVDQLGGYLRLCFHICKKQGFSLRCSIIHVLVYYFYIEVYKTAVINKIGVIFLSLLKYVYFDFFVTYVFISMNSLKRYIMHNFEIVVWQDRCLKGN